MFKLALFALLLLELSILRLGLFELGLLRKLLLELVLLLPKAVLLEDALLFLRKTLLEVVEFVVNRFRDISLLVCAFKGEFLELLLVCWLLLFVNRALLEEF